MSAPPLTLRVHTWEDNRQDGTRVLVAYTPFLRLGAPSSSGHAGEVVFLQHGYVYGEGGDPYAVEDLPYWFPEALMALTPQARLDVGFTVDRVQWYTGWAGQHDDVSAPHWEAAEAPPVLPASPSWKLGWLCPRDHDYQNTGMSRYNKRMRCVDCEHERDRQRRKKGPGRVRGAPVEANGVG